MPATGSTVYNVGSVSKVIAAAGIVQLVAEGKVSLDDSIQKYVPSFPYKGEPITIHHLVTHISGIRHYRGSDFPDESAFDQNWRPYESITEATEIFKDDPLLFSPGEFYSYTSYGVNLLQGVVETASGLGFEDYLRRHDLERRGSGSLRFGPSPEPSNDSRNSGDDVAAAPGRKGHANSRR